MHDSAWIIKYEVKAKVLPTSGMASTGTRFDLEDDRKAAGFIGQLIERLSKLWPAAACSGRLRPVLAGRGLLRLAVD